MVYEQGAEKLQKTAKFGSLWGPKKSKEKNKFGLIARLLVDGISQLNFNLD